MFACNVPAPRVARPPWTEGWIVRQKRPLLPQHFWSIQVRLELTKRLRGLALFNFAINNKLHGCELVRLRPNHLIFWI